MTLNITGLQLSKVHSIVIFLVQCFSCVHIFLIDICLQLRLSDLKKKMDIILLLLLDLD
jgi:hypothetical protein